MSTETLSDYNVSGQRTALVSRSKQYSDLDLSLIPHPNKKDIMPLTDIDAVRNSVKNLILTSRYERPFQPNLGSGISSLLFENSGPDTLFLLKSYIRNVISNYEPRVNDIKVIVEDDSDNNAYYITVSFNVISVDTAANVELYLERVR
jgi:phage baseplate assembly protein W|tara:strand:+ start:1042 stop:1485 length:444 start_codon:yes stop_codon:yes gene_type:complete